MARVTSDFFVSALVRRVFGAGGFAAVERRGSPEAGAIYIRQRHRDGLETLYAPAPQTAFEDFGQDSRSFEIRFDRSEPDEINAFLEREKRMDPDFWTIELETDSIEGLFNIASA